MATPSKRSRWVLISLTVFFLAAALSWGYVTERLTSAPYLSIANLEREVSSRVLPDVILRNRPKNMDQYQHFLFYLPFGLLAGIGAELARGWWRGSARDRLRWLTLPVLGLCALGWAGLDEWQQRDLPDRVASWGDLSAGWLGIVAGIALYVLVIWFLSRRREKREALATAQDVQSG
ncbi:hypothetical protein KQI84_10455 [bacterium]|nr:hypothetical protein [bacterium]